MKFEIKHNLIVIIILVSFIALSIFWILFSFGIFTLNEISSQNAYIKAKSVDITSKINSKIIKINVKDFDKVKKGDILFELDDRIYKQNLLKAQANLSIQQNQLKIFNQQSKEFNIMIKQQEELIEGTKAIFFNAKKEYQRSKILMEKNAISKQSFDNTYANYLNNLHKLEEAKLSLEKTRQDYQLHLNNKDNINSQIELAKAEIELVKINLDDCKIKAPFDGVLGEILVSVGDYANKALVKEIDNNSYIILNLKETQLNYIKIGKEIQFKLDAYKDKFNGVISDISPATGSEFASVKIDNSIGNFIKITQKIPVKIEIIEKDNRIKPGMSVKVFIKK